jgi:hypothetical protein
VLQTTVLDETGSGALPKHQVRSIGRGHGAEARTNTIGEKRCRVRADTKPNDNRLASRYPTPGEERYSIVNEAMQGFHAAIGRRADDRWRHFITCEEFKRNEAKVPGHVE